MSRIVVIGGINMDLHLFGGRRPSSGATLLVDHYLTQPGGKGSNAARAAARLVCPVAGRSALAPVVRDADHGTGGPDAAWRTDVP